MLNLKRKDNFGDTDPMQTEDKTEMDVTEINCEYVDRIQMAQEKVHGWIIHNNKLKCCTKDRELLGQLINPESLLPRFRQQLPHPNDVLA
jgi:hypothetical protein